MRKHNGEQVFDCTICNERFNQSSILNKHLHTHIQQQGCQNRREDLNRYFLASLFDCCDCNEVTLVIYLVMICSLNQRSRQDLPFIIFNLRALTNI